MNRFLAIVLLASLAFAHLPSTPASFRKSPAHKKRLGDPPTVALRRGLDINLGIGLVEDDNVSVSSQSSNGALPATINSVTTSLFASPSSSTPSSPESSAPTPPPSGSSSSTSPTPDSVTSSQSSPPGTEPPPSSPAPPSSTPTPAPSSGTVDSQSCGLFGCILSPAQTSLPAEGPPPQTNQPSSTTDASPSSPTPVTSSTFPTQPPLTSSNPVAVQFTSTPDDHCLGIHCPPPSNPSVSNSPAPTQPPSPSSNSVAVQFTSTPDDHCLGIHCPPPSDPSVSNSPTPTQPPSPSSNSVAIQSPSTTDDHCIGTHCFFPSNQPVSSSPAPVQPPSPSSLPSSIPAGSDSTSTWPPQVSTNLLPPSTTLPQPPGSTRPFFSEPLSTTSVSPSSDGSTSDPSATSINFPTSIPGHHLSPTPVSLTTSTSTSPPVSTNTQLGWVPTSLVFSTFSEPAPDSVSFTDTDVDKAPTSTSFLTSGTPSVAPSVAPLPFGMPARIVPPGGGVNAAHSNNLTLIAILFRPQLGWDLVRLNPNSSGQICLWTPVIIATALNIDSDQVKTFGLQVWIPASYKGPSDTDQLGTVYLGYIPKDLVGELAAEIKIPASQFYNGMPPPCGGPYCSDEPSQYKDLSALVDPSFDIRTFTATTEIPGSGGPNNSSSGGTSDDSRTRENTIIGVVCALGGTTLITIGYLIYRAVQKRRELAHRRLSDPPTNAFTGEAPPNRNFDQDSIGGQRRRSFYFAEDSLRGFSDHNTNDSVSLTPEQTSGLNRRQIAGNIGPPVMRENSLNF